MVEKAEDGVDGMTDTDSRTSTSTFTDVYG